MARPAPGVWAAAELAREVVRVRFEELQLERPRPWGGCRSCGPTLEHCGVGAPQSWKRGNGVGGKRCQERVKKLGLNGVRNV
jgi:hypothetical protein